MPRIRAKDRVTIAFHYLDLKIPPTEDGGEPSYEGFDKYQIAAFREKLLGLEAMDLEKEDVLAMLRSKTAVPIDYVEEIDSRTLFGRYKGVYWGHGYENTHAGYIPPESVSLRPFYFLVYFSTDGKIYIGCQYLGQFGSYTGLKNTLIRLLGNQQDVAAHSFRSEAGDFESLVPKEVRVTVSSAPISGNGDNVVQVQRITVLTKIPRGSDVQREIKRSIVARKNQPEKLREEVSTILRRDKLISFDDEDIVDCVVVAEMDGKPITLHFMQEGIRSTQFELKSMVYEVDGHPQAERVKTGGLKILEERVLAKSPNA